MQSTAAHRWSTVGWVRMFALVLIGVLGLSSLSAGAPPTARAADEQVVPAAADATALRGLPNTNLGSKPNLFARRFGARFYVRFDLSAWQGQSIASLNLQLTVTEGDGSTLRFRRTSPTWDESTVTWNNSPAVGDLAVAATSTGPGTWRVDLRPFFPGGTVATDSLSLRGSAATRTRVAVPSRESGGGPVVAFVADTAASDGGSNTAKRNPAPLRFYTPNISAAGDSQSPARDTDRSQLDYLFSSDRDMSTVLGETDVYVFFAASLNRGDAAYDAMVRRAIPMLKAHGVKLGLEVGGPIGYQPGVVYGGDVNGANGRKSAEYDLAKAVGKIESMGGTVDFLMLDGALRRTIRNGVHRSPHAAFLTIGLKSLGNALRYRALVAGSAGNSIRVGYAASGPNKPLAVFVSGSDITVQLATDAAGHSTSTAAEVRAAVSASAAVSLISVTDEPGSDGSGIVPPRALAPLAWGDGGLNMTVDASAAEVVSYIAAMSRARPGIRYVLIEDVILWPYAGRAGYASVAYPDAQRPDFSNVWNELVRQLRGAGLLSQLVAFHNDVPVEYLDKQVSSINKNADDWYGRIFKQQAQVEGSGVAFGQHFNSLYGGSPTASSSASASTFQSQVLHAVNRVESYRLNNRPDLAQMGNFAFDAFMYYPRVVSPSSVEYSTDDTYLDALNLYRSFRSSASLSSAASALVEFAPAA